MLALGGGLSRTLPYVEILFSVLHFLSVLEKKKYVCSGSGIPVTISSFPLISCERIPSQSPLLDFVRWGGKCYFLSLFLTFFLIYKVAKRLRFILQNTGFFFVFSDSSFQPKGGSAVHTHVSSYIFFSLLFSHHDRHQKQNSPFCSKLFLKAK